MKTAISLPDEVFEAAEDLAEELGISRSHLYARALAEFVGQHTGRTITQRLNAVYADTGSELDPVLEELQSRSLDAEDW